MRRVRVEVEGGVLHVVHIPEGVELEVIEYDVEGENPDELDRYEGVMCHHWVERSDHSANDCEYDSDEGWKRWNYGRLEVRA